MATNGLSTTFNGVTGEGWIRFTLADTASVSVALPDEWKDECVLECIMLVAGGSYQFTYIYNPQTVTSIPIRIGVQGTTVVDGASNVSVLTPALLGTTAVNAASLVYIQKDNTTGKLRILQSSNATREEVTFGLIRRIG
jgi:hypothetical protein